MWLNNKVLKNSLKKNLTDFYIINNDYDKDKS